MNKNIIIFQHSGDSRAGAQGTREPIKMAEKRNTKWRIGRICKLATERQNLNDPYAQLFSIRENVLRLTNNINYSCLHNLKRIQLGDSLRLAIPSFVEQKPADVK